MIAPKPSSLYLIEAENGLVKIGCSKWPAERLKAVRLHCCEPTRLIAAWPGRKADELALHARFEAYRIHTEWFRPEGEFASFVDEMLGHGVERIEDWSECRYRPSALVAEERRKQKSEAMKAAWAAPGARERWQWGMRQNGEAKLRASGGAHRAVELRAQGLSYAEIGEQLGVSRQRAQQIVKRHCSRPQMEAAE